MSKAAEKLAKLAGFGMLAGSEPAASAREVIRIADAPAPAAPAPVSVPAAVRETPAPAATVETPPTEEAAPAPKTGTAAGKGSAPAKPKAKPAPEPERENLTRNVVFLPADQAELDRIEDLLRSAGIRKPTIADLVRVALRAARPTSEEAASIFRAAKALDARRAENKTRPA